MGRSNPVARRLLKRTLYATRAANVARARRGRRIAQKGLQSRMRFGYRWIKDGSGTLDRDFVALLAGSFGIDSFVETGTYRGDSLAAVRDIFARLISVELSPDLAAAARSRFAGDAAVSIIEGDSAAGLGAALASIPDRPAILWLDAHYSGGATAKGDRNTPIQAEIEQILSSRDGR